MSSIPAVPSGLVPPSLRKSRRKWLYGGVAVVVALGVAIPAILHATASSATVPASNIYRVGYGSVVQTLNTSGTMQVPTQVNLTFQGTGGVLSSLSASVGQSVRVGQVLARLNDASVQVQIAQAQAGVAQARGNLAQAQANLAKAQEAPTAADLAVYQTAVDKAATALQGVKQQYADQQQIFNDRLSAKQQVVVAQHALQQAQAQAAAQAGNTQSVEAAQLTLVGAQANLTSQQQTLKTAQVNLATAQQNLNTAQNQSVQQQNIKSGQVALSSLQQQLSLAQANLTLAQQALKNAQAQYGSITEAQVQQAYQQYQNALSNYNGWQNGGFTGSNPYSSNMQAANTNYTQLSQGYQDVQSAQQAYNQAQGQVTSDQSAIASSQSQLTQDQSALGTAQNQVTGDQATIVEDQNQVAGDQAAIASVQKQVAGDQQLLANAKNQARLTSQADQLQVQQDKQTVQLAQAGYSDRTSAKQALDNARNQVQQAVVSLQSAQASLVQAKQPPASASVQAAQAGVQTSQASLQSAQASLQSVQLQQSDTVLTAPINGVVTQVNDTVGDQVSASQPVLVVDGGVQHDSLVNIQISESQISSIHPGEPLQLTVSSLPNDTFNGKVTQIYPVPQVVSNVTEYTVMANVNNASNKLQPGMTANVTIQTAKANHVLTVPAISLVQLGSVEGVFVVGTRTPSQAKKQRRHFGGGGAGGAGGAGSGGGFPSANSALPKGVYFQPVQIGLFGTQDVEITKGVRAGETIMLIPPGLSGGTGSSAGGGGNGGGAGGGGLRGGRVLGG